MFPVVYTGRLPRIASKPHRVNHYLTYENELKRSGISCSVTIIPIKWFERLNKNISVNLFDYHKKNKFTRYVWRNTATERMTSTNLLLLDNHCYIRKLVTYWRIITRRRGILQSLLVHDLHQRIWWKRYRMQSRTSCTSWTIWWRLCTRLASARLRFNWKLKRALKSRVP